MKVLIVSNYPLEEYQFLCIRLLKRYCFIYNIDFMFLSEYEYDEKYTHIIYIDNTKLLINLNIDIRNFIKEDYDLIYSNNYKNENKFFIVSNKIEFNSDINILKEKTNKIFIITNYIVIDNNSYYPSNNNLDEQIFLDNLKASKIIFYCNNNDVTSIEIINYLYYQIFNKIYNNKKYLDININYNKYNYEGDVEIFNPNKDIAFVTLYTYHIKEEGREMEYSLKEYCIKNDYTCYIHRKSELEGIRHPTLEKPYLLKKYLNNHKYVIWIDSDVIMFDQNFKIENEFNDKYDLIAYKDPKDFNLINAGFLIFKNNQVCLDIINKWIFDIEDQNITILTGPTAGDQGILIDIVKNYYLNNTLINDNSEINSIINNYKITNIKIIHLMGIYGFIRLLLMKYLNYIIFEKLN